MRDKLVSFSGEGLDKIAEVDPTVVLKLLDENLVDRVSTGSNVVTVDEEMPRSRVDDILRSELQEKRVGIVSKRPLDDVDVGAKGERPSKSVAFQFDNAGGRLSAAACELLRVSYAGQSFPVSSRPEDTDFGASELESIARKRVDDVNGKRVHEVARMGLPCSSGTRGQQGLGTGRSINYPSDSARTLLKECFADNPPLQLDPHQQLTGMSSDQMVKFVISIGLEVSLATFGMLEDVLLKTGGKTGRNVGHKGSGQSLLLSRAGSTIVESIVSRSSYALPTITESFGSDPSGGVFSQQLCSSRQADAALGFLRTEVTDINDSDSLKTLGQIRCDVQKKGNLYKWSREGRPNSISPSGLDDGGYVFTEEMLKIAPFEKIFATGPENPLKNWHCFLCMICKMYVSMKSRDLYEKKAAFLVGTSFEVRSGVSCSLHPSKIRNSDARTLYGSKLEAEKELFRHLEVPEVDHKRPFYYDGLRRSPLLLQQQIREP